MQNKSSVLIVTMLASLLIIVLSKHAIGEKVNNTQDQSQYYIYTLQLISSLLDIDNWTEKENKIVEEHSLRLKQLRDEGIVTLAGRVPTMDPDSFGIVIFKADSEEKAMTIMNNDPSVKEGIMTAKLYPFRIALMQLPVEFQVDGDS